MIRYCTSTKWVYVSNNEINHFSFKIQWCGLPGRGRAPHPQLLLLMGLASNMGLMLRIPWSLIQVTGFFMKLRPGELLDGHNSVNSQHILMGLRGILPICLERVHHEYQ